MFDVQDVSLLNNDVHYASANIFMGTPSMEPRARFVGLKFTDKEYAQLRMQMENVDILSVSKYIRAKVLDESIPIHRKLVFTDRNLRNQINRLSTTITRIGTDYNQITKRMNALLKMKNPDGSLVVNPRSTAFFLNRIHKATLEIKEVMNEIIDKVDTIDYDNKPHEGDSEKTI